MPGVFEMRECERSAIFLQDDEVLDPVCLQLVLGWFVLPSLV